MPPPVLGIPGFPPGLAPSGEFRGDPRGAYPWWYPQSAIGRAIEWATLGTQFLTLAAGTANQAQITVGGGFAFVILETMAEARDAATDADVPQPNVLVQLQDSAGDANLFNAPLHIRTVFGTAEEPHYWGTSGGGVPRILAPNTSLTVSVTSREPAIGLDLFLAFGGFRIWGNRPE